MRWILCVPKEHRTRVLNKCHDQPTAGHQGFRKTINRVTQRYHWPGIFSDVARYVRNCETCRKFKASQLRPPGGMLYHEVTPSLGTDTPHPDDKARHLREIFKVSKEKMQQATIEQSKHYTLRRREWRPAIGDMALLRQHHLSKASEGLAAKLAPRYNGPYKVNKFTSPNIVRVQYATKKKRRTAGLADLKAFHQKQPEMKEEEPCDHTGFDEGH